LQVEDIHSLTEVQVEGAVTPTHQEEEEIVVVHNTKNLIISIPFK
jgi:hypothetical protein